MALFDKVDRSLLERYAVYAAQQRITISPGVEHARRIDVHLCL